MMKNPKFLKTILIAALFVLVAAIVYVSVSFDINHILPEKWIQKENLLKDVDGIDVSHHQGNIDWKKVKESCPDLKFVYIKATEGKSHVDPRFSANAKGASLVGYNVGAYHYFRMTSSAHAQFANFKKQMDAVHLDLLPMVDVETNDRKPRKQFQDSLKVFLDLLEKEYGKKPVIYGTQRSYNSYCAPEFNDYPLYIGKYSTSKPIVIGPSHYSIWQFSETGIIPGIPTYVDLCKTHPDFQIEHIEK